MRAAILYALLIFAIVFVCTSGPDPAPVWEAQARVDPLVLPVAQEVDPWTFDIVQRTCALYVAVRSRAFEGEASFGQEPDAAAVHWNMCPGGTMVACAKAPTASGDSVLTGIPWPY